MTDNFAAIPFTEDPPRLEAANDTEAFLVDIDGFEGPIDVLLAMARAQKVDLAKISILQLARQYLEFIEKAKELRLDLAAEYLVMAAWLAYLKSRLLLPREDGETEEPDAETMAAALQFQLMRLEAMREAANDLFARPQLGQDIFPRGMPEGLKTQLDTVWDATLYDLLRAYGDIERRRTSGDAYELPVFHLMSTEEALERMTKMLGKLPRKGQYSAWTTLRSFIPEENEDPLFARSALASGLTAGLELTKQGRAEMRQDGSWRPVYLRGRLD